MKRNRVTFAVRCGWSCWAAVALLGSTGCVSRRLMVQSDPPGALVVLEGREIGYTPTAVDFTYYATRELTLIKDGYETLTVLQPVRKPWYQQPGIDFVTDNFLGRHVTDRQAFRYKLQPKTIAPDRDLLNRANQLRNEGLLGQ